MGRDNDLKNNALLIFLRYPQAGRVKRRLSEEIGSQRAAEIYEKLVRRTLGIACDLKRKAPEVQVVLFHTPEDPIEKLKDKFRGPWKFRAQEGEHLGERMANALRQAFVSGADKAVLIGTDLADIEMEDLQWAFRNLDKEWPYLVRPPMAASIS